MLVHIAKIFFNDVAKKFRVEHFKHNARSSSAGNHVVRNSRWNSHYKRRLRILLFIFSNNRLHALAIQLDHRLLVQLKTFATHSLGNHLQTFNGNFPHLLFHGKNFCKPGQIKYAVHIARHIY